MLLLLPGAKEFVPWEQVATRLPELLEEIQVILMKIWVRVNASSAAAYRLYASWMPDAHVYQGNMSMN